MFGDKRVEKKKTVIYKCNLNPIFNATFEFDVPWEQIRDCALDVQVMDFDTVGRNELIGKILLACESGSRTVSNQYSHLTCERNSLLSRRRLTA
jgi:Ca2+-dependent lipid-binding protein